MDIILKVSFLLQHPHPQMWNLTSLHARTHPGPGCSHHSWNFMDIYTHLSPLCLSLLKPGMGKRTFPLWPILPRSIPLHKLCLLKLKNLVSGELVVEKAYLWSLKPNNLSWSLNVLFPEAVSRCYLNSSLKSRKWRKSLIKKNNNKKRSSEICFKLIQERVLGWEEWGSIDETRFAIPYMNNRWSSVIALEGSSYYSFHYLTPIFCMFDFGNTFIL